MKTWAVMYGLIWLSFFEIIFILFSPLGSLDLPIHALLGVGILALAFLAQRKVKQSACPDRIKRITKTTWVLAIFQGVLGVALAAGEMLSLGAVYDTAIKFLHVVNALAIITQASSSATAFDMWEEKEFQTAQP